MGVAVLLIAATAAYFVWNSTCRVAGRSLHTNDPFFTSFKQLELHTATP
jgi:hypothetical protein